MDNSLVPAPMAGDQDKFLCKQGTTVKWAEVNDNDEFLSNDGVWRTHNDKYKFLCANGSWKNIIIPTFSLNSTVSINSPKNGLAFVKDELIDVTATVTNTGNVNANNIRVSFYITGSKLYSVTVLDNSGYQKEGTGAAIIMSLSPGESVTVKGTTNPYGQSYDSSFAGQFINMRTSSNEVSEYVVTSSEIKVSTLVPQTASAFSSLAWSSINNICTDVENGDSLTPADLEGLLGFTKSFDCTYTESNKSTTRTFTAQLVATGNPLLAKSPYPPSAMTFQFLQAPYMSVQPYTNITGRPPSYNAGKLKAACDSLYDGIYSTLKPYIKSVRVKTVAPYYMYGESNSYLSTEISNQYLFVPSLYELSSIKTYGEEGEPFNGRSQINKQKRLITTSSSEATYTTWYTRTFLKNGNNYYLIAYPSSGYYATNIASTTNWYIAPCFCI